jgi:DNA-binding NarL/FixJ family response regulator
MEILIVDGSAQVTERLTSLLTEPDKGRTIYTALSFTEAIALFEEKLPALVLLDRYLPENKSIELLKIIKTINNDTKVIILYFFADIETESHYKLHGADFFLDKYNDYEQIPEIINKITS